MSNPRCKTAFALKCSIVEICRTSYDPIMGTLTFAENVTDLVEAKRRFRMLEERIRRRLPRIQIVGAWEEQTRGAWHPHFVASHPVDVNWLRENAVECGFGQMMRLERIHKHRDSVEVLIGNTWRAANYIAKYVTKGIVENEHPKGLRVCFYHGGSRKASVRFSWASGLHQVYRAGVDMFVEIYGQMPSHLSWSLVLRIGWESMTSEQKDSLVETSRAVRRWLGLEESIDAPF